MNGKRKCKILKEIRQKIAQDNDIAYVTSECKHQGDCAGTCPKCESELRYLEQELAKRQRAGKAVAVAGVALAVTIGAAGCGMEEGFSTVGDVPYVEEAETITLTGDIPLEETEEVPLMGDPAPVEETPVTDAIAGEIVIEEPLMGDVPYEE